MDRLQYPPYHISTLLLQSPYVPFFLQQHVYRRVVFKVHPPHFRPPYPLPWPSYSIGISGKWPQTRNLSSKITNTTLIRCFKEATLHTVAYRSRPCDCCLMMTSFTGFKWKSNLPNWYTSTTCIFICKDVSVLGYYRRSLRDGQS